MRFLTLCTILTACVSLGGCMHIGPRRLDNDEFNYSRALGDAEKREALLNVVRLRYGDAPEFLQATQVISAYSLQHGLGLGTQIFPGAAGSNFLTGTLSGQEIQNPTFTFQPLSGSQFAQSFIRPLTPSDLAPLAMGGLPIDVLFRLGVQNLNGLSNAVALADTNAGGAPDFFLLLHDLRRLQIAGLLGIRLGQEDLAREAAEQAAAPKEGTSKDAPEVRVFLSIAATTDPELAHTAAEARRLMGMRAGAIEAELIYGQYAGPGQIPILTRSMLGVLNQLAIQIEVPDADVAAHRTLATVGNVGSERRPIVIVHSGPKPSGRTSTILKYGATWFWIDDDDFDSKLAFTVLQVLLALSRTDTAARAVLSIPTR